MDWATIIGTLIAAFVAVVGVFAHFRHRPKKTVNKITNGHRNKQSGGEGTTHNTIKNGDDNDQKGAAHDRGKQQQH